MQENILCICDNNSINKLKENEKIKCEICHYYQHISCISPSNKSQPYICPICQFKHFDPYLRVKYHFLIPQIIQKIFTKKMILKFNLNDSIFHMFFPENNDILLLRCLKLTEEGFSLEWPDKIRIFINDHQKEIYSVDKNNDVFKRQINEEIPFILNKHLTNNNNFFNNNMKYAFDYFKLNEENIIKIIFNSIENSNDKYIITLDFINMIDDVDKIIKNIKVINDINELKRLIKPNRDILEYILFVDLITKIDIIDYPARGWKCNHFQCFDLKIYLNMQKKTRRFCCPICNKKIGKVYIDGLMKKIIDKYSSKYEGVEINDNYEIVELFNKNIKNEIKEDKIDNSINLLNDDDDNEELIIYDDESSSEYKINKNNKFQNKSTNASSSFSIFK